MCFLKKYSYEKPNFPLNVTIDFQFIFRLLGSPCVDGPLGISGGSSVSQNKLPQLILGYISILKYLQSNFSG